MPPGQRGQIAHGGDRGCPALLRYDAEVAAIVLDGRRLARLITEQLAERVKALAARGEGKTPTLAIVLAGADDDAIRYARLKVEACRQIGIEARQIDCPADATTAEVEAEIDRLDDDRRVHGIFLQHPLPGQVDERRCFDRIALAKDVGGDSSASLGRLAVAGQGGAGAAEPDPESASGAWGAATAAGIMRLLAGYGIAVEGREAAVVGRSPMVGKPLALMLLGAHATVTLCHSRTRDLPALVQRAGIVVGAVGKPAFIKSHWIRDGAVVIDAGLHPGGAVRTVGDVELGGVVERCSAYTPVPGGVGPMTVATLLERTVAAAERAA
jgi:methylenetetrahydrofolate dehydrogenase (NADP+)/methenyltetrahydrofolate cyclohydrolase